MKIILNVQPLLDLSDEVILNLSSLNGDLRIEVNRFQQLVVALPSFTKLGFYRSNLLLELALWNEDDKFGEIFGSSSGFRMPKTNSVLSPNLSWIENSRSEGFDDEEIFWKIAPDFIADLYPDFSSLEESKAKMEEYIENGVKLAWLFDLENKKVYIYRLNGKNSEQSFEEKLSGEEVLPKFELNLRKIFKK